MEPEKYSELLDVVRYSAARVFELADTEYDVRCLEQVIQQDILYATTRAHTEKVKPTSGWVPLR